MLYFYTHTFFYYLQSKKWSKLNVEEKFANQYTLNCSKHYKFYMLYYYRTATKRFINVELAMQIELMHGNFFDGINVPALLNFLTITICTYELSTWFVSSTEVKLSTMLITHKIAFYHIFLLNAH